MPCDLFVRLVDRGACLAGPDFQAILAAAFWIGAALTVLAAVRVRAGLLRGALGAAFATLALAALAIAAARPVLLEAPRAQRGMVVALVDASRSVWREPAAARAAMGALADAADRLASSLPRSERELWSARIRSFAAASERQGGALPLARLGGALRSSEIEGDGEASHGGRALLAALGDIREAGGRGAILLLSDGLFDGEDERLAVENAAAAGIAIHVLPTGATRPAAGLLAADLGPEQRIGRSATVRATVLGRGTLSAAAESAAETEGAERVDAPQRPVPARVEAQFVRRGLRHLKLRFAPDGGTEDARLLYTLVRGPARLLAIGAAPWADGLDPATWDVTHAAPEAPPAPGSFDVVALDAVSPDELQAGYVETLLAAADGTGVLLVNGPLQGARDQPQRIGDWNASALSPILPVDSDPRKFVEAPPPRDVAIMIDISGSMAGQPLTDAVAVARLVLDQLRPIDKLAILPFASGAATPLGPIAADRAGLERARRFLGTLSAGGGTDPNEVLGRAARLASNYCAFFFLSDGGFSPPVADPRCYTTSIDVDGGGFDMAVWRWGDVIEMRAGQRLKGLDLPYFQPKMRDEYWRDGGFAPRGTEQTPPTMELPRVEGLAIAYPRVDAEVWAVHETPPPDPVFALRRDPSRPGVTAAAFLGDLGPWGATAGGRSAIETMLGRIVGWNDPDRFDIRIRPDGQGGDWDIAVTRLIGGDRGRSASDANRLDGRLVDGDGRVHRLFFERGRSGALHATVAPTLGAAPSEGLLILEEPGGETQRIPVSFPAREDAPRSAAGPAGDESRAWGVDLPRLGAAALATGGAMLDRRAPQLGAASATLPPQPVQFPFIALALASLCLSLWAGEKRN